MCRFVVLSSKGFQLLRFGTLIIHSLLWVANVPSKRLVSAAIFICSYRLEPASLIITAANSSSCLQQMFPNVYLFMTVWYQISWQRRVSTANCNLTIFVL